MNLWKLLPPNAAASSKVRMEAKLLISKEYRMYSKNSMKL